MLREVEPRECHMLQGVQPRESYVARSTEGVSYVAGSRA